MYLEKSGTHPIEPENQSMSGHLPLARLGYEFSFQTDDFSLALLSSVVKCGFLDYLGRVSNSLQAMILFRF